jgi:pSer/pThr/pTyr-binding forkhead associated (FHA) protein
MASHEDVSYTRIVGPPPAEDTGALPAPGVHPALVWRPKLGEEHAFPLDRRISTLGRHEENDIVLAGPTVSGRHATVRVEGAGATLEDEGSLNGTFVNGERVERTALAAGDRVQIGPHLLVFVPAREAGPAV